MKVLERLKNYESIINDKLKNNNVFIKIYQIGENEGNIITFENNYATRVFYIKACSSCQIDISEDEKIIERGMFVDHIGEWLFNLYNTVEYLYCFYGGKQKGKILKIDDVKKISDTRTENMQKYREKGLAVHRKELDEQPIVDGYIGPMFEKIGYGKVYLRYETPEIYEMLST